MKLNVHLVFAGNCSQAFDYYEVVFAARRQVTMTYGDAPQDFPVPENMKDRVMHTSLPLGGDLLMGCDSPPERAPVMGGFQVAVQLEDESEVKRVYTSLADGGSVQMPLTPTFWSPLFGMCTDKFGVAWMVSLPGPQSV